MADVPLRRRLAAEGAGTALLLATIIGSGITAESLAGANVALALLGNTLPTAAILAVIILVFGPVSGAGQWLSEAMATFGLVLAILCTCACIRWGTTGGRACRRMARQVTRSAA